MSDATADAMSDDTSALTVRPGLWPWVDENGKVTMWVVVSGFYIGDYWVEDGFVTDLASIPAWLSWVPGLNPYAPDTAAPAAGHDWLLKCGVEEREAAGIFYAHMRRWGVGKMKRIACFLGVLAASSNW